MNIFPLAILNLYPILALSSSFFYHRFSTLGAMGISGNKSNSSTGLSLKNLFGFIFSTLPGTLQFTTWQLRQLSSISLSSRTQTATSPPPRATIASCLVSSSDPYKSNPQLPNSLSKFSLKSRYAQSSFISSAF